MFWAFIIICAMVLISAWANVFVETAAKHKEEMAKIELEREKLKK